jgi:hypothetical protein
VGGLSFLEWCFGCGPICVGVCVGSTIFARFPLINWAILFFLINGIGKAFALFKKKLSKAGKNSLKHKAWRISPVLHNTEAIYSETIYVPTPLATME